MLLEYMSQWNFFIFKFNFFQMFYLLHFFVLSDIVVSKCSNNKQEEQFKLLAGLVWIFIDITNAAGHWAFYPASHLLVLIWFLYPSREINRILAKEHKMKTHHKKKSVIKFYWHFKNGFCHHSKEGNIAYEIVKLNWVFCLSNPLHWSSYKITLLHYIKHSSRAHVHHSSW